MRLQIRSRRLEVGEMLRAHVKRQLRTALGRLARRAGRIQVYLRDVNGPRGGLDKRCRIVIHLPPAVRVVVSGAGTDPYAVTAHTAARSGRAVKRHLKRRFALHRRPRHKVGNALPGDGAEARRPVRQSVGPRGHTAGHCGCQSRHASHGRWALVQVSSGDDEVRVADAVAAWMAAVGFSERDVFGMGLALAEAVANAIRHGHGGDRTKAVRVRYRVEPTRALVVVQDEGPGFDPAQVPDPRTLDNLDRRGGRGLLLMRHYATRVRFSSRGNVVTLLKRPSTPAGAGRNSMEG